MKTILICTVGGSHQPILKSILETKPDYVCFICTGPDPETGQAGSERQIEGKGNVISLNRGEPPSLPNIPQQAGLGQEQFSVCRVPADDLDQAFSIISAELDRLGQTCEEPTFIADYTGGTKTMTAALVTAALETSNVKLQLVTGARANLVKVTRDSEYAISANVDGIRLKRSMQPFLDAWARYAYDEAASGLGGLPRPQNAALGSRLNRARNLSRAFSAWDRFDHHGANEILQSYRAVVGKKLGLHLKTLTMLNEEDGKRREPLQLYDLWLNAHRRAAQGRYDDAVARVYRLIEWTAQWQLRQHQGFETADIPKEKIPADIPINANREGKYQAGLMQSWQLVGALINNPAGEFITANDKALLNHLLIRNQSILAHGFSPIGEQQWQGIADWMQATFLPMLRELIQQDAGIRFDLESLQLPDSAAEFLNNE